MEAEVSGGQGRLAVTIEVVEGSFLRALGGKVEDQPAVADTTVYS